MGVEQDGLGVRVPLGELYEVERWGVRVQGNAGRPHEGPPSPPPAAWQASGLSSPWNCRVAPGISSQAAATSAAPAFTNRSTGVTKGQAARERGSTLHGHCARAFRIQHESHRIGSGLDGGVQVLLAGDAADLDARAEGWGVAAPAFRLGRVGDG